MPYRAIRENGQMNMSIDGDYEDGNIFAKILRGEAPSVRVFEDSDVLAFMDVFPQGRGHTLVIAKHSRARNLLEVEPEVLGKLILGVQRITRAVRVALNPDAIMVAQFNGAASGQSVFHLHFQVSPRWAGMPLRPHGEGGMADPAELAALAHQIAAKID
jgi:histidine triad (HIT) family protein